ncbi:MAG TPA: MFS transporter [Xanthobacteraceae bacterium]|nr:MFS transporter [Xanthobacteraceae bacterium]
MAIEAAFPPAAIVDSRYAWFRLGISLLIGTLANVGMWSYVVALPTVQAAFSASRADASLPFTLTMIGFGVGGVAMGRLADRAGIMLPVMLGALLIGLGYVGAGFAANLWAFAATHLVIGFGTSAAFGPLMADVSHWFLRRRGVAVAIAACGNYVAGTVWPPVLQHFLDSSGWRATHIAVGLFCLASVLPLAWLLRPRLPQTDAHSEAADAGARRQAAGLSPGTLMALLTVAAVACCVAMAMPQVHIVAYCGDLGYGPARGAEMLSLMLGFGLVARLLSGLLADRAGGLVTLLVGSVMQGVALLLYLGFDSLTSLYVISALFGLFQGGIVPSYAIVIREFFAPQEAGWRVGVVLMASILGMAFGGWVSGLIFDLTGSYRVAFAHGVLWNLLHASIVVWLLTRRSRRVFATA